MAKAPTPRRSLTDRIKNRKLPNIEIPNTGDPSVNTALEGVKDHLLLYEGSVKAPKERFVTLDELEAAGIVGLTVQRGFASITNFLGEPVQTARSTNTSVIPTRTTTVTTGGTTGDIPKYWRDLEDVEDSSRQQYSMAYFDGGNWRATAGDLLWDPDLDHLQLEINHGINWMSTLDTSTELLALNSGGGGGQTVDVFERRDQTQTNVTDPISYTTATTIDGSSLVAGDTYLVFYRGMFGAESAASFNDPADNSIRIRYGGLTLTSAATGIRAASFVDPVNTDNGTVLGSWDTITADGVSDFTFEAKAAPSPENLVRCKHFEVFAINLSKLGPAYYSDLGTLASGAITNNTVNVYANIGGSFTLGDGESDYLLFLSINPSFTDTHTGSVPDFEVHTAITDDGTGPMSGSDVLLDRFGGYQCIENDSGVHGAIVGLKAPDASQVFQMRAKWTSLGGYDSADGSASVGVTGFALNLSAFADHHLTADWAPTQTTSSGPSERFNETWTAGVTGDYFILAGLSSEYPGSGNGPQYEIHTNINLGGDVVRGGDQDRYWDGSTQSKQTGGTMVEFPLNEYSLSLTSGDSVESFLKIWSAPNSSGETWHHGFVCAFAKQSAGSDVFYVGDPSHITHVDGSTIELDANTDILSGASLDIWDSTDADKMAASHDGTDMNFEYTGTTDHNFKDGVILKLWDSTNADNIAVSHDGTDVNFGYTNTTDHNFNDGVVVKIFDSTNTDWVSFSTDAINAQVNMSGLSAFQVHGNFEVMNPVGADTEVVRVVQGVTQFGAGSIDLYYGTEVEWHGPSSGFVRMHNTGTDFVTLFSTTQNWDIQSLQRFQIKDGAKLVLYDGTDADSVEIYHDGTDLNIDLATGTTTDINFHDGPIIKIWDSTDAQRLDIYHNGTDAYYDVSTGQHWFHTAGTDRIAINSSGIEGTEQTYSPRMTSKSGSSTNPCAFTPRKDDPNTGIYSRSFDDLGLVAGQAVAAGYDETNFQITISHQSLYGQVADVSQVQGASIKYSSYTQIDTVANENDSITLTNAYRGPGTYQYVQNHGANRLQVFPYSGDYINDGAVNVSDYIEPGKAKLYIVSSTEERWREFKPDLFGSDIVLDNRLASTTYYDFENYVDGTGSVGTITGGVLTDDTLGAVNISEWEGLLRSSASATATLYTAKIAAATGQALTDNAINYIYAEYNAGTPAFAVYTSRQTDRLTKTLIGIVHRSGTTLHITEIDHHTPNAAGSITERLLFLDEIKRESGAITSETGTRNIAITAGTWWLGIDKFSTSAIDTSVSGTFTYYYQDGLGGWTTQTAQTQINNTQYDDGSGTLATLSTNRYGVHWVYKALDDHIYLLFGRGNYTLIQAEAAQPPSNLPDHIHSLHGVLVAKIIIQETASTFTSIQTPFDVPFTSTGVADHGDLGGLTDDDHTQYVLADGTRAITGAIDTQAINIKDGQRLYVWDSTNVDNINLRHDGNYAYVETVNASRLYLRGGDILLQNAAGTEQFKIGWNGTSQLWENVLAHTSVQWEDGDGNHYYTFNFAGTNTSGFTINRGNRLELRGTTGTNNAGIYHDNTDLNISKNSGTVNNVNIRDGMGLRIYDGTDTDSARFSHDGTDFNTAFTTTTDWNITGIAGFNVVNYNFDVDQTVGVGQDNYVLTYDNATGLISLEAAAAGGGGGTAWEVVTAADTIAAGEGFAVEGGASSFTITIEAVIAAGDEYWIHNSSQATGTIDIEPNTGHTIKGVGGNVVGGTDTLAVAAGETVHLVAISTSVLEII